MSSRSSNNVLGKHSEGIGNSLRAPKARAENFKGFRAEIVAILLFRCAVEQQIC